MMPTFTDGDKVAGKTYRPTSSLGGGSDVVGTLEITEADSYWIHCLDENGDDISFNVDPTTLSKSTSHMTVAVYDENAELGDSMLEDGMEDYTITAKIE